MDIWLSLEDDWRIYSAREFIDDWNEYYRAYTAITENDELSITVFYEDLIDRDPSTLALLDAHLDVAAEDVGAELAIQSRSTRKTRPLEECDLILNGCIAERYRE